MLLNKSQIISTIQQIQSSISNSFCVLGGSAALVIQGYLEYSGDIDIIQHYGERITLGNSIVKRLWSYCYNINCISSSESFIAEIDMHYSNPFNMSDYSDCFYPIIMALDYIDSTHSYWNAESQCNITNPIGAGLINWIHCFLEYGFNEKRIIFPYDKHENRLRAILSNDVYNTIQWKAKQSAKTDKEFIAFVDKWRTMCAEK